jgi:catechol 2,3-dioxygenase-like lactoylglutathione lyase family enzyme
MKKGVNPMGHGHFCFRTDDIKGFMRRCDELGIRYEDYGCWAIPGWHQVFLYDPDGHCIEVHQPNVF